MTAQVLSIAEQFNHFLQRPHRGLPDRALTGPAAWLSSDVGGPEVWRVPMSPTVFEAFEAERADGVPSSVADAQFESWRHDLLHGRGFVVATGVPVAHWGLETSKTFTAWLGRKFGLLGLQNTQGDLIAEVKNTGIALRDPYARNYITDREFRFHCDAADLAGLLCIRKAASGGISRLASAISVFNRLRAARPDLARLLFEPVLIDLRNEKSLGDATLVPFVPCAYDGEVLRTFYVSDYFRSVERHKGVVLAPETRELFDMYEAIAESDDVSIRFQLEPGDLEIVNNHFLLHARTAFQDEPGAERLLLRFHASVPPLRLAA